MAKGPNSGQNMGQNARCAVPKKIRRNVTMRGRGNSHASCVSLEDAIQRTEGIATLNCHLLTSSSELSRFRVCSVGRRSVGQGAVVVSQRRCSRRNRMTARVRTRTELGIKLSRGDQRQMQREHRQGRRLK